MKQEAKRFYVSMKGRDTMTASEINAMNRQTADLLYAVSQLYSLEVAESVIDHYGDMRTMSRWEQAEMDDDLISKLNDAD